MRPRNEQDRECRLVEAIEGGLDLKDQALVRIVAVEQIARDRDKVDRLRVGCGVVDRPEERREEVASALLTPLPHRGERGADVEIGQMQDANAHRFFLRSMRRKSPSASRCARNAIGRGSRSSGKKPTSLASSPALSRPPVIFAR